MLLAGTTARFYRSNIDSLLAGHGGLVCHHQSRSKSVRPPI
jgi:hypothetical protein